MIRNKMFFLKNLLLNIFLSMSAFFLVVYRQKISENSAIEKNLPVAKVDKVKLAFFLKLNI